MPKKLGFIRDETSSYTAMELQVKRENFCKMHAAVRRCTDSVNKHMFNDEPKGWPLFEQAARMP